MNTAKKLLWRLVLLCLLGMSGHSLYMALATGESNLPFKGTSAIKVFRDGDPLVFWPLIILNVLAITLCAYWLMENKNWGQCA